MILVVLISSQGRGLEEVDELFAAKLWAWQFKKHETHEASQALTVQVKEIQCEGTVHIEGHEMLDSDMKVF